MKIGIPNAMLSHKYLILWETFFKMLDCEVIISEETNKEILNNGLGLSNDESCLPSKIYMGHVFNLINKCDYIFIPRFCSFKNGDTSCVKFNALYDICGNIFDDLKIITYNIDYLRGSKELQEFLNIGKVLGKSYLKTLKAYIVANNEYKKKFNTKYEDQIKKLIKSKVNDDINILIVTHPYIGYDAMMGLPIAAYLKKLNSNIIYADIIKENQKGKLWNKISKTIYWRYSKELLSGLEFYKTHVDGVVFISVFSCGPDSLVTDLCMRKLKEIPCINLILDELNSDTGIQTRLESFIDILIDKKRVVVNE